ncbi:MAG TPA: hypothetical protein VGV89_04755 [Thermoplasmata archaeon]|nr:hypothetical protein [Thermoplasmata archaeon]
MSLSAWAVAILVVVGGVIVLNHLGVGLGAAIGTAMHGLEHFLGRPL